MSRQLRFCFESPIEKDLGHQWCITSIIGVINASYAFIYLYQLFKFVHRSVYTFRLIIFSKHNYPLNQFSYNIITHSVCLITIIWRKSFYILWPFPYYQHNVVFSDHANFKFCESAGDVKWTNKVIKIDWLVL